MICAIHRVSRSSVYAAGSCSAPAVIGKRGPKTRVTDDDLVVAIRAILTACPFHGEGYRKVRARLTHRGYAVSGKRVLRLMRAHGLLAPRRLGPPNGNPAHDGTIITDRPDVMWGTDATRFYTEQDGWCWFFGAIDHHLDEVVGWHTAKLGDRWAALEPIRQGVRHAFGRFGKDVARGLALRCD
jgi:transposase InsO family protein